VAKQFADLNTNAVGQLMLAQLVDSGRYDRTSGRLRAVYRERRDVLLRELSRWRTTWSRRVRPAAAFFLWCRLRAGPQARLLAALAARAGVAVVGGEAFRRHVRDGAGPGADGVRLTYSGCTPRWPPRRCAACGPRFEQLPGTSGSGARGGGAGRGVRREGLGAPVPRRGPSGGARRALDDTECGRGEGAGAWRSVRCRLMARVGRPVEWGRPSREAEWPHSEEPVRLPVRPADRALVTDREKLPMGPELVAGGSCRTSRDVIGLE